jgi:MFS transporter, DHA2 family, multidrug resistance protein
MMGLFGVGVMVGPVLGPVLGGWLTENYSWRYVFYINLPIGIIGLIGMSVFLPETKRDASAKLDWLGFGTLSVALGALQVLLDRGEIKDWFSSGEIVVEAIVAACALYLFLVHTFTTEKPFVRPALFRDRNFAAGVIFIAVIGLTYYASLALLPPYLRNLMKLSSPNRRHHHGPARHRHHGCNAHCRPSGRSPGYATVAGYWSWTYGVVVLRHDRLDARRFARRDRPR